MRALGIIAACVFVLIGGTIAFYKLAYPDYVHRYRLTLAIEADGKVHTGSGVIEVIYQGQPYIPGAGSYIPHVRGQAAFIDLGKHGVIVAALHPGTIQNGSAGASGLAMIAYGVGGGYEAYRTIGYQKGRRELKPDNMPLLIWFPDVNNPKSARVIKQEEIPVVFGPAARLVSAYVEITSDPIVIDIDKKLPWYPELANRQRMGGVVSRPDELQPLGYNMFIGEGS
jgi:hypothetical protein